VSEGRAELVRFCRLGWERGYLAATDGNLSVRLGPERVLVTPSGRSKAVVAEADLVEVDLEGRPVSGGEVPSSEVKLHLAAYQARPEIGAVAHAHPPLVAALCASGVELDISFLPEALITLGPVPLLPYRTPGTRELARGVGEALATAEAALMAHHGSVTVGADLEEAWARTEKLEHAAAVLLTARGLGGPLPLPAGETGRLSALGGRQAGPPPPLAQRVRLDLLPRTPEFLTEKRHADARGQAHLIVDSWPAVRVGVLTLEPGTGHRGGHLHRLKREGFYLVSGRARVELACPESGERQELTLEPGHRLFVEPGVAHRIEALEPLVFVELCDRSYDPEDDVPHQF
jgi:L-fuculose-phosphate aldolase